VLTEPGRIYLESCRRLLGEIETAERMAAGEYATPKGRLHITAPIVFGRLHVLPMALAFLKAYPEVDLRLSLVDRIVDMIEEGIDVALRIAHLADSSLIAARVGAVKLVTCAAPAYLKANGAPRTPGELIQHHCISSATMSAADRWWLAVTPAEAGIDAAIAGIGVARVLSYQVAAAVKADKLKLVLRPFELPEIPVSLVHPEARLTPPKVRAFLDFATPRLRQKLATVSL
jgi:DNA-binding transcriptional LysR family regulator